MAECVDTSLFPGSLPSAAPAEASPRIVIFNSQHFADIFYSTVRASKSSALRGKAAFAHRYEAYPARRDAE